jgi:hypothetical protein
LQAIVEGGWLNAIAFGVAALLIIVGTRGRLSYQPLPALPGHAAR